MTRAVIYCRVSTETQEQDGTSLQTQLDNCLKYCHSKDYTVSRVFQEVYSGLKLDRPILNDLRNAVRAGLVDVVVVYSLDRLTRDPGHGVILTQEFDKHNVRLEGVSEDIDNSELGKLIGYIRGFASKVEAEKIKERTDRGKRAKAELGFMSTGGRNPYGYDYVRPDRKRTGKLVVNELEAIWVRKIFYWYTVEGQTHRGIATLLNDVNAPVKSGKPGAQWNNSTVKRILSNESYIGKTVVYGNDIPGLTEAIIDLDTFEAAREQRRVNRERASRNASYDYLLGGHLTCKLCGSSMWGYPSGRNRQRYYKCSAKWSSTRHVNCESKSWLADDLEPLVWTEIERYLKQPDLIIAELERQIDTGESVAMIEAGLKPVIKKMMALDKEQLRLLQWGIENEFPEAIVKAENKRLNDTRGSLIREKAELETRLAKCHEAEINRPNTEEFINVLFEKVANLDYEGKRLALQALNVRVLVGGSDIGITGCIPTEKVMVHSS